MNKKIISFFAIVLVSVLILTSCGIFGKKDTDDDFYDDFPTDVGDITNGSGTRETLLYFQDDAGYLIPVMRRIPWETGIAKAALRKMMDRPEEQLDLMSMGLRALLPADTEIIGMSISDEGLAKVDFNSAAMEYSDAVSESNMVQGVVLTLCAFPAIDEVQFLFEGKKVDTLKFGTRVGDPIAPQNINWEMGSASNAEGARVTVFFHTTSASQFDYLVPVTRVTNAAAATLQTAIEELLKGPIDNDNLHMNIPEGTELLGIELKNGVTCIDFSDEFLALSESIENEEIVLRSIIMTAKQFPEVYDVKITVNGKEYKENSPISLSVFANEY